LLLRFQHVTGGSGEAQKLTVELAKRKTPKGGQKERTEREDHDGEACRV